MLKIVNLVYFKYKLAFLSDGRLLSEPFMKQPPKKDYPDYYEIIKKPIDITKIMNRIEEGKVRTIKKIIEWESKAAFFVLVHRFC